MTYTFLLGCGDEAIDYLVDDRTLELVQNVLELLDGLGHWLAYEPAVTVLDTPVYIEQDAA